MPDAEKGTQDEDARWLWCGPCRQPVTLARGSRYRVRLYCTNCGRSFEWQSEPPGGEENGLPPFLGVEKLTDGTDCV